MLFPPKCSFCDEILIFDAKKPWICKKCKPHIKPQEISICENCGKPQDIAGGAPFCPYCSDQKFKFKFLIAPFKYTPYIREGIHHLKFNKRPTVAETFAVYIYERLLSYELTDKIKLLVPAPISKKRFHERGYNQSELICKKLSELSGIPYRNSLIKIKNTLPQSSLDHNERKNNIKDAIAPGLPIPEDDVLFVDDVYTTGSTCAECCKVLKQMNVKRIYVAVSAINKPKEENEE